MSPPTSKTIAVHLKELRKAQKLSVGQVCQYLAENGYQVAAKTVYGWESGRYAPNIAEFLLLAELYQISSVNYFVADDIEKNYTSICVTDKEKKVIERYRKYDGIRNAIDKLLDIS